MKRFLKKEFLLVAFGIVLFVVLWNLGRIFNLFGSVFTALFPIVIGFVIAFILNVPMRGFENLFTRIFAKAKHKPSARLKRYLSLLLTFVALAFVVFIAVRLVVPILEESVSSITKLASSAQDTFDSLFMQFPKIAELLGECGITSAEMSTWVKNLFNEDTVSTIFNATGNIVTGIFSVAASAVSGLFTAFLTVFVAIYALLSKDKLAKQTKRLLSAIFKTEKCDSILYAGRLLNYKYSKYLSGQCIEACILGVFSFLVLIIFRVPNAFVISFITAVLAFVPYIGAFCAFGIGAVLTLISDPSKLIAFCLIYVVVQIVETQFICPHVVGNSVGLSPLWTLIAVFVGSNLLGFLGIILFIPLFSVITTLVHQSLDRKLGKAESCLDDDPRAPKPPEVSLGWTPIEHVVKHMTDVAADHPNHTESDVAEAETSEQKPDSASDETKE